jgi:hypothetical protein
VEHRGEFLFLLLPSNSLCTAVGSESVPSPSLLAFFMQACGKWCGDTARTSKLMLRTCILITHVDVWSGSNSEFGAILFHKTALNSLI